MKVPAITARIAEGSGFGRMGAAEWGEVALFSLGAFVVLALLVSFVGRVPERTARAGSGGPGAIPPRWLSVPELRLLVFGFPLELLWEIAHFPLYDVWHRGSWSYVLYGLAHCTLGDLLILLVLFGLVAALSRDRHWYRSLPLSSGAAFTLLGIGYTVFSEIHNVRVKGTWGYTELMPVVPVVEIGATPFFQWLLIPPVLVWLMRLIPEPTRCDPSGP